MAISLETLARLMENLDDKHVAAHRRLREDLTEGFINVQAHLQRLEQTQQVDHEAIVILKTVRDVKLHLDASRLVIFGALTSAVTSAVIAAMFYLIRSWVHP